MLNAGFVGECGNDVLPLRSRLTAHAALERPRAGCAADGGFENHIIGILRTVRIGVGGFPFDVRLEQPNKETIAAMLEAERIAHDPTVKRYSDVEEALRALKE